MDLSFVSLRRGNLFTQIVAANRLAQTLRDIPAPHRRAQADILNAILALLDTARPLCEQELAALSINADHSPP